MIVKTIKYIIKLKIKNYDKFSKHFKALSKRNKALFSYIWEGEYVYFAKIPKGSSYVEIENNCIICDKVIIR